MPPNVDPISSIHGQDDDSPEEVFQQMFDQSWRALTSTSTMHSFMGRLEAIRQKYRPLDRPLPMKEDLYSLVSLMFGELNASHLGISGTLGTPDDSDRRLRPPLRSQLCRPGLKIAEIIKGGPADRRGVELETRRCDLFHRQDTGR